MRLSLVAGKAEPCEAIPRPIVHTDNVHEVAVTAHLQQLPANGPADDEVIRLEAPAEEIPMPAANPPKFTSRPIGSLTVDILPPDVELPPDESQALLAKAAEAPSDLLSRQNWTGTSYQWEAAALCHRPLYFEEVNLERYGYACGPLCQPVVSGARFFATVPILPYKMTVEPCCEHTYTLGHYRPGSCVPNQIHWMPLRPKAGLVEAGAITGLIFAVP